MAALLALPLFAGCLSTTTRISLDDDGSGTIALHYEIHRTAWETGVFDESDVARAVPVTRVEFASAALSVAGLALRSHSVSVPRGEGTEDDPVTVDAELSFDGPEALRRFLGADSLSLSVTPDGGHWELVVARGNGADGEGARALAASLEGYTMVLELDPPAAPTNHNGAPADNGRRSRFTLPLSRIVTAVEPVVWEVRW
jgi:hypothetical protein